MQRVRRRWTTRNEVTLKELVRRALRMNLRRMNVGEVRDIEVLPM
jgi:Flp pilus assembly CpaF family ATPase